ncbi:hypothetical protein CR513_09929, partial [Mucuna pruriens]
MSPYQIVFGKACHLLLSSATWPITKQGSKENSSCNNWTNSAWKLMRTLGSIIELKDERTNNTFQVNRHQIKQFHEGPIPIAGDMKIISLMEPAPPDDTP